MAEDGKFLNFISESQVEEIKQTRGERVEDGTASTDRPLYDILKEAKEKKDAEFNEKFKNLPPKALDEDESEFLEAYAKHERALEKERAENELRAVTDYQAAIASRTFHLQEKEPGGPHSGSGKGHALKPKPAPKRALPQFHFKVQPKKPRSDTNCRPKESALTRQQGSRPGTAVETLHGHDGEADASNGPIITKGGSTPALPSANGLGLVSYDSDDEEGD